MNDPSRSSKHGKYILILAATLLAGCDRKSDRSAGQALDLTYPPEVVSGTEKPIDEQKAPNLVPVPDAPPKVMVPAGTTLLSKGKPVTSSDTNPVIGTLDLITDGDKLASDGSFVELFDGLQWVQVDLEQSAAIHTVMVWHFFAGSKAPRFGRAYHDVVVRISDDPEFKHGVTTVFNNDYDDSARLGQGRDRPYAESRYGLAVDAKGTKGRYVRLYSNGNTATDMNNYIEVEVHGTP